MEVNISPGVGMLALFPSMKYKSWYAISEFIDNSLQSYLANYESLQSLYSRNYKLEVRVDLDRSAGRITVSDNAAGIYTADISRAFTPAVPPSDSSGLSQFGIGMKSAACWFAREFQITTTALGEDCKRKVCFDVPALVALGASHIPVFESSAPKNAHGTTLELWNLYQNIPQGRALGAVRDYLWSIYRNYITRSDISIYVNDKLLEPREVPILCAPRWDTPNSEEKSWQKEFTISLHDGTLIPGWAALRRDGKYRETGFALSYRNKIVQGADVGLGEGDDLYRPHSIFGATNSFVSLRLFGELDVSSVGVSYSKDAVAWTEETEQEFLQKLKEELDAEPLPLLKMAVNSRKSENAASVQKAVESALENATSALSKDVEVVTRAGGSFLETDPEPSSDGMDIELVAVAPDVVPRLNFPERELMIDDILLRIRVIDDPASTKFVSVLQGEKGVSIIEINRSHKYVLSFGNLPGQDFEAVLRIGIAMGLSELKAKMVRLPKYKFQLSVINELLNGELAERLES